MYNVFLVDDEIVIRESIRASHIWDNTEFVLAGEASDGEIALSMLQDIKPDILITDIKMPFMDGLALCQQVKQSMPWMRMIILSGYDDFTFAKQAITLGVTDYLLKPVDMDELLPVLERIAREIDAEKENARSIQELKQQADQNKPLLKERILQDFFSNHESAGGFDALLTRARKVGLSLTAKCYLAALLVPQYTKDRLEEAVRVERALKQLADGSGGTIHLCTIGGWPVALIMGDSDADLEERSYGFAQSAQFSLERDVGLPTQISIGEAVYALPDISRSLQGAQQVARTVDSVYPAEQGSDRIVGVHDMVMQPKLSVENLGSVVPIDDQLKYITSQEVEAVLDRYAHSFGASALQSKVITSYMYVQLLMAVTRLIQESGGTLQEVLPQRILDESLLESLDSAEDVRAMLVEMLRAAIALRDERAATHYSAATQKALNYVHEHYSNIGISMREVATHVALSNSHFSTVFSQEVGTTFTEYLTALRIAQAKKLLAETDLRSQEIASRVGYNDRHYFSYLFKKVTGMSPTEYRKR